MGKNHKHKRKLSFLLFICLLLSMLSTSACSEIVSSDSFAVPDNLAAPDSFALPDSSALPDDFVATNPILVVVSDNPTNPFAAYIGEILNAEGFQGFSVKNINELTADIIAAFDVVILTEMSVTTEQHAILEGYVADGGSLIGMQPDESLHSLFGIINTDSAVESGYIRIDTTSPIGLGLESETLKFHGTAETYTVSGNILAYLYTDRDTASQFPAVAVNEYGNGRTAVFSFSLSQSIVFMRQGNPERAGLPGQSIHGNAGSRPIDLMYVDGVDSFNDSNRIHIPQADEKMRFLSRIIEWMSPKPLPRLWYLPDGAQAVLVVTGDSDGGGYYNINDLFNTVRYYGGRASIYLIECQTHYRLRDMSSIIRYDENAVQRWTDEGHEIGIHFDNTEALIYTNPLPIEQRILDWDMTQEVFERDIEIFNYFFPDAPHPVSVRNHWLTWLTLDQNGNPEFAAQAIMQYNHGIRLDFNPYSGLFPWQGGLGFQNGSGLPMRLATSDGSILGIYQSDTQLADEVWREQLYSSFKTLANQAIYDGRYAWLNTNLHPLQWPTFKPQAISMFQHANFNNIPIWSGRDQYDFTSLRDRAFFSCVSWDDNTLSFTLVANEHNDNFNAQGLTVMIPLIHNDARLDGVTRNGVNVPYTIRTINEKQYAFVFVNPGEHLFSVNYIVVPN